MDKTLLLTQLIANGDIGSSGGGGGSTDTLVLDYDCNDIFYSWVEPDENHPDYYLLEAGHEDNPGEFVEDPLYNDFVSMVNNYSSLTNVALATHKIICCGADNCANVIFDNFRITGRNGRIICDIHYFSGGYWCGVLLGKVYFNFESGSVGQRRPLELHLDTEYGVNTLDYNRSM